MSILWVALNLLILAVSLWVLGTVLDLLTAEMGVPANLKKAVVAVLGLIGLVAILSGYRFTL